jgi:peroxiredoxin
MVSVAAALLLALPAWAGEAASDFTLRDIDGNSVTLSELEGKVVVLSFWATWCGPCKEEMPHLQKMLTERRDKGFEVLSISTDDARSASRVKPFIKKNGYEFTVLLDRDSTVIGTYNPSTTLPYTVVIDQAGQVAKRHSGYNPGDEVELAEFIDGLLDGGAAPAEPATDETASEG